MFNEWIDYTKKPYAFEIKEDGDYRIYKYTIDTDFSLPICLKARGIITYIPTWEVVCYPFDKFFNYWEQYAAEIDWSSAKVQEKVDGSLMKVWYHNWWHLSTNNTIDASKAIVWINWQKSFADLFNEALQKNWLTFKELTEKLDVNYTYMFELVSPDSQVVLSYPLDLYHIGTRAKDGAELEQEIGIKKPKQYLVSEKVSLDIVLKERENLEWLQEWFVVVDKDYHRIKVKTDDYIKLHHECSWYKSDYWIIDLIQTGDVEEYITYFPSKKEKIESMQKEIDEFHKEVEVLKVSVLKEKEELLLKNNNDVRLAKKDFVLEHCKDKYSSIEFWIFDWKELNLDYKKYYYG